MLSNANYKNYEDSELIDLYKSNGSLIILGELYTRYMSLVYGVCLNYLKDREESKDATMQIFEKIMISLKEHEVLNFKSWLYVLAKNYCLMQIRSNKSKNLHLATDYFMENSIELHLEDDGSMDEDMHKLEKCIDALNDEQKWCVKLFYIQQKCYKEISNETGYDNNKVKSYIQNGKRNLKVCMERV